MSRPDLQLIAEVTLDAYLLANAAASSPMDGRAWERFVARSLVRSALSTRQGPGGVKLFGLRSASGAGHELDAAGQGQMEGVIIEAKANGCGATKSEVSHFHVKTFDFFCTAVRSGGAAWWRILASASAVSRSSRAVATHLGIQVCDPTILPLPLLLWVAGRPTADAYLPETLLSEAVRLFEPVVRRMDQIWRFDWQSGDVMFSTTVGSDSRMDDLLFIQDELSGAVLDLYDRHAPLRLPNRTAYLMYGIRAAA